MGELLYPFGLSESEKASLIIPDYASDYYCMDYSRAHITAYLNEVKSSIRSGSFVVLVGDPDDPGDSRRKNYDFMLRFGLWHIDAQKDLLLSIVEEEFCHTLHCNDGRNLYVFCIDRELSKTATVRERVRLYVKHDFASQRRTRDVVISLHALEKPIMRAFEE